MAANALVQTRIDEDIKERATAVLEKQGLTISDAVRILLTRTANEGVLPLARTPMEAAIYKGDGTDYDAWFRAKVQEALDDPRPGVPHAEVRRRMNILREKALAKIG
ncbi:type II toxin-antitoxin system RelB/DinJ family antitoxin [Granulicella sp. 5B5]|uniref:type II toxin-antitoxin system RelB family antitoxin n=1 Tax=Granulicella sp. 5B5 TaxID=1617967 RepID=UPI0015F5EE3A|nr:type II toxin-antitoxin system RelB/DinJ family antitoxin [Granulicella sp. 5B5]QMV17976.1 type II toxin-antitoxin system RelB/DinJ family antitoxin [Granulicella sp. 5B5]